MNFKIQRLSRRTRMPLIIRRSNKFKYSDNIYYLCSRSDFIGRQVRRGYFTSNNYKEEKINAREGERTRSFYLFFKYLKQPSILFFALVMFQKYVAPTSSYGVRRVLAFENVFAIQSCAA